MLNRFESFNDAMQDRFHQPGDDMALYIPSIRLAHRYKIGDKVDAPRIGFLAAAAVSLITLTSRSLSSILYLARHDVPASNFR